MMTSSELPLVAIYTNRGDHLKRHVLVFKKYRMAMVLSVYGHLEVKKKKSVPETKKNGSPLRLLQNRWGRESMRSG